MSWPEQLSVSVSSGVLVAAVLGVARHYWRRRHVPTAMAFSIRRSNYLQAILECSTVPVDSLKILAPRLSKASDTGYLPAIQDAWSAIAERGRVQVVTRATDSCLEGAVELAARGIETRIARSLDVNNLTYHVFESRGEYTTVLNDRKASTDRPVRVTGHAPARIFRRHFQDLWDAAEPLESALADRVLDDAGRDAGVAAVRESALALRQAYGIDPDLADRMSAHVAFKHGCGIVFIVGLPGAGKSYVRARLARRLASMHIKVTEATDYVYAYRDFLHGSIRLSADRGSGFQAEEGGAFQVAAEESLQPALRALAQQVLLSVSDNEVTLVEFARADILAALREFGDDIRRRAHVIYVQASEPLRDARLRRRANPPLLEVSGLSISVTVSDNHRLPSTVGRTLYGIDDLAELRHDRAWTGRLSYVENDVDDTSPERVDDQLAYFMQRVTGPYAAPQPPSSPGGHP